MKFYVYHLVDPRTDRIFYIGKGVGNRIGAHERESALGVSHPKCDLIREIWAAGKKVTRQVVKEFKTDKAAYEFEKKEIARIGLEKLSNIRPGGGGYFINPKLLEDRTIIYCMIKFSQKANKYGRDNLFMRFCGLEVTIPDKIFQIVISNYKDLIEKRGKAWCNDQILKMVSRGKLVTR